MLRYLTAGESHGKALVAILEGLPAGLALDPEALNRQLSFRQKGYGRGGRMKIERDRVEILSGLRWGKTLGSPLSLLIKNLDWEKWQEIMKAEEPPADSTLLPAVTRPRPGHADLAGAMKYGHRDLRNVLERASARETAARVAVGAVCQELLRHYHIEILGLVTQVGKVEAFLEGFTWQELRERIETSDLRCPHKKSEALMKKEIDAAKAAGDSLGGVFQIFVMGAPPGLGSYVHWDRKLDGRLAQALMSIQAIKGVEIGMGFAAATLRGSQVHDPIKYKPTRGFYRQANHAGGLEGGVTNGEVIVLRAAMKPIPTLTKPLPSVDFITKMPALAVVERADVCAVASAAVIGEAVVAYELAQAFLEKFGGDSMEEIDRNYQGYLEYLKKL
jgi:chorismate synthase